VSSVLVRDAPPADPREIDGATLRAAQRREPRACRALVRFYEKRVYAFLWRMLEYRHGQAVVDEQCQETFLRVFMHLDRFEIEGSARLSTWMLTIAARLALNQLRRREPESLEGAAIVEHRAEGESTEALIARSELARLVGRALASLPAEQRAAIVLREYHELGYAEIAEALAIDVGTVKSRLSRARGRIREMVGQ
jgi:RNA polymerase sigma-70 factor, ECF subfamily